MVIKHFKERIRKLHADEWIPSLPDLLQFLNVFIKF